MKLVFLLLVKEKRNLKKKVRRKKKSKWKKERKKVKRASINASYGLLLRLFGPYSVPRDLKKDLEIEKAQAAPGKFRFNVHSVSNR